VIFSINRVAALRAASLLGLAWRDLGSLVTESALSDCGPASAVAAVYERAVSRISGVSMRDTMADELSLDTVDDTVPGIGQEIFSPVTGKHVDSWWR
jgi:hypothetical protein